MDPCLFPYIYHHFNQTWMVGWVYEIHHSLLRSSRSWGHVARIVLLEITWKDVGYQSPLHMGVSKNGGTQQLLGFPTKNDHFGMFWGYHYFWKHPYGVSFGVTTQLIMVSFPCKDGIRFYYNNVYRRALARRMRDAAIPEDVPYHKNACKGRMCWVWDFVEWSCGQGILKDFQVKVDGTWLV